METTYIVFGEDFHRRYFDEDFDAILRDIDEIEYDLYVHRPEDSIEDLLMAYTGWQEFVIVLKEEFEQLEQKRKEQL